MAPHPGDLVYVPLSFDFNGEETREARACFTVRAICGGYAYIDRAAAAVPLTGFQARESSYYEYTTDARQYWCAFLGERNIRISMRDGAFRESNSADGGIEILGDKVLVYQYYSRLGFVVFGTTLRELELSLALRPFSPFSEEGDYLLIPTEIDGSHEEDDLEAWRQRVRRWTPKSRATVAWEKGLQQAQSTTQQRRDEVKNSVAPSFPKKKPQEKPQEKTTAEPSRQPIGVALNSAKAGEYVSVCVTGGATLIDTAVIKALTPAPNILAPMSFHASHIPPSAWSNQYTDISSTHNPVPTQKEDTMATNNPVTTPTPFDKTVADAGAAIVHGASVAAAQEAYDAVLELVTMTGLPSTALGFLQTTMFGRVLLYVGLPTVLLFLCNMFPSSIPQADNVNRACKLVIDGASRDFLRPMFAVMASPLKKLAAIGASAVETPPSEQK